MNDEHFQVCNMCVIVAVTLQLYTCMIQLWKVIVVFCFAWCMCKCVCIINMLPLQTELTETFAKALGEKLAQLKHTWLQLCCADCWTVPNQVLIFFLVLSLTSIHELRSPWATCQNSTESPKVTEMSTLHIYLNTINSWHRQLHKQYNTVFLHIPHSFSRDVDIPRLDFLFQVSHLVVVETCSCIHYSIISQNSSIHIILLLH